MTTRHFNLTPHRSGDTMSDTLPNDPANPCSMPGKRSIRIVPTTEILERAAKSDAERLQRREAFEAGHEAGRRSVDVHAWMLMSAFCAVCITLLIVWFGSLVLAGI